jgi:hypothetical protein
MNTHDPEILTSPRSALAFKNGELLSYQSLKGTWTHNYLQMEHSKHADIDRVTANPAGLRTIQYVAGKTTLVYIKACACILCTSTRVSHARHSVLHTLNGNSHIISISDKDLRRLFVYVNETIKYRAGFKVEK